jgi:Cu/Ag efflux protein CusF
MKRKMIVLVAVLTVIAFAFGAMAQQQKTTAPAKPAPAPKLEKFSGTIAAVDAMAKTFDVKAKVKKQEKTMTFATDEKTKITKGKEAKTFADLKVGMRVYVEYNKVADQNMAVVVKIAAPKSAPKTGK